MRDLGVEVAEAGLGVQHHWGYSKDRFVIDMERRIVNCSANQTLQVGGPAWTMLSAQLMLAPGNTDLVPDTGHIGNRGCSYTAQIQAGIAAASKKTRISTLAGERAGC
jgi:hypothetical protein